MAAAARTSTGGQTPWTPGVPVAGEPAPRPRSAGPRPAGLRTTGASNHRAPRPGAAGMLAASPGPSPWPPTAGPPSPGSSPSWERPSWDSQTAGPAGWLSPPTPARAGRNTATRPGTRAAHREASTTCRPVSSRRCPRAPCRVPATPPARCRPCRSPITGGAEPPAGPLPPAAPRPGPGRGGDEPRQRSRHGAPYESAGPVPGGYLEDPDGYPGAGAGFPDHRAGYPEDGTGYPDNPAATWLTGRNRRTTRPPAAGAPPALGQARCRAGPSGV